MKTIYEHDSLSKAEFLLHKTYVFFEHRKFILSYEMSSKFNDLLNVGQKKKDTYWPIEGELLDLVPLLNAGGVVREDHIEKFLDIAFEEAQKKGKVNKRAMSIGNRWRALALEFREG